MITIVIIAVTCIVSIIAFSNQKMLNAMVFNAYLVYNHKKIYRLFSHGLVHGSWGHLFFNMLTLYFFGTNTEQWFQAAWGKPLGAVLYVLMYVSAFAVSSLADLRKYRYEPRYNALGASGAVSAVLFASVLFDPMMGIYIYLIPIPVPGFVFAPLYLLYCWWMAKRNRDNIGHSAHFWGAVYGFIFPIIFMPSLVNHFLSHFVK